MYGSLDNEEAELQAEAISAKATTASGGNLAYTATEVAAEAGEVAVDAAEVSSATVTFNATVASAASGGNLATKLKGTLPTEPLPTLELSLRATGFQFGDEPGGISTLVGIKGGAQLAPGELKKTKQSASCELIRAISPACIELEDVAQHLAKAVAQAAQAAQAAKANEVSVAHDAAQVATQVVAAAPTDAAAQTISAAYSTTAGGMSPMALMPASDTSSAQGQLTAAQAKAQRTCVIAALDRVADDSKFGKRPSGNITLER